MADLPSLTELDAYLDEALSAERMSWVEESLRENADLREQLKQIIGQRDAGVHSLGGIWRRHRLSCPSRTDLGSYLLGVLPEAEQDMVKFHLDVAGCPLCQASVRDLESQQAAATTETEVRRKKYFQSSIGHLPHE
jgi:anti-sigma factor RsiW